MCTVLLPPGVNPIALNKYMLERIWILYGLSCEVDSVFVVLSHLDSLLKPWHKERSVEANWLNYKPHAYLDTKRSMAHLIIVVLLTLEDGSDRLSWNFSNYKSTLRNSPEEGRFHLHPPRQKHEISLGTPRRCNVRCAWTPVVTSMYSLSCVFCKLISGNTTGFLLSWA